jgi:hypothetical protein
MFLGVETNDEGGHVDNLLADAAELYNSQPNRADMQTKLVAPNVSLPDQNSGMMNALRQTTLENLSLQPPLQEIFNLQCQHVIEPHPRFIQHTNTHEPTDECVTLEETLGIFVVELEELTGSTTDFGQDQGNSPDFTLVAEAVLAGKLRSRQLIFFVGLPGKWYLELSIETSGFERSTRDLVTVKVIIMGQGFQSARCIPSTKWFLK